AAERRKARPARVMGSGDLRRSGDRLDREAGHRVRRIRTSACRRSAPLIFLGSRNGQGASGALRETGGRSFGCLTSEDGWKARLCNRHSGRAERGPESIITTRAIQEPFVVMDSGLAAKPVVG